jgi:hypothetical protein
MKRAKTWSAIDQPVGSTAAASAIGIALATIAPI